jgi:uncharacterized protein
MPAMSEVLEVDLRTYVRGNGVRGVYYLTMEASNPRVGFAARTVYHMPYRASRVTKASVGDGWRMDCHRDSSLGEVAWSGEWQPVGPEYLCEPDTLESRFIDQWELYTRDGPGHVYQAGIHRIPWILRRAKGEIRVDTFAAAFQLELLRDEAHLCCSDGADVLVWWPRRVREG